MNGSNSLGANEDRLSNVKLGGSVSSSLLCWGATAEKDLGDCLRATVDVRLSASRRPPHLHAARIIMNYSLLLEVYLAMYEFFVLLSHYFSLSDDNENGGHHQLGGKSIRTVCGQKNEDGRATDRQNGGQTM